MGAGCARLLRVKPLVSILIPAHNAEAWIAETIRSALAQTWRRTEIIIVDDRSTDQTLSVAKQFRSKSVLVIKQSNQSAAVTRNEALSKSQGDFIQWLDADDLLSPNKIEAQINALSKGDNARRVASGPWGAFISRTSRARFRQSALWHDLSPKEWLSKKMGENLHMQTGTWLVSRELTEAAGPWDTRLSFDDDGEYFCRILVASCGTRFVPEAKTYYRKAAGDSLGSFNGAAGKLESLLLSMQLHVKYLLAIENSARTRASCMKYLQNWLPYFYPRRVDLLKDLQKIAASLGGELKTPRVSWKYSCIQNVFGPAAADNARWGYNRVKKSLLRSGDRALCWLNKG
jgi:glycosyltransferase involved in cell wall biosynthesis